MIGNIVKVTVDRPLGSYHPKHKDIYYPINYGYIEGIIAPDGEEQDAYILGVDKPVKEFVGKIIAIIHRFDDVEEKWVVVPEDVSFTKEGNYATSCISRTILSYRNQTVKFRYVEQLDKLEFENHIFISGY